MHVRRIAAVGMSTLLVIGLILMIPSARTRLLRSAGDALVAEDALEHADAIVLTIDAQGAGVLEAADLVHGGIATRVAVFDDPLDPADVEFRRRGLPYAANAERTTRQLREAGVQTIDAIGTVEGTESESDLLTQWCDRQNIRTVVVVAPRDHSRRLRRVLKRTMRGHHTKPIIRAARFSAFEPDRWWQTRGGIRTEIVETEKLWLDILRHPFS
jgi:hypothetical protein